MAKKKSTKKAAKKKSAKKTAKKTVKKAASGGAKKTAKKATKKKAAGGKAPAGRGAAEPAKQRSPEKPAASEPQRDHVEPVPEEEVENLPMPWEQHETKGPTGRPRGRQPTRSKPPGRFKKRK